MQVRIANRQDEKAIRELAEKLAKSENRPFDLKGGDSDLVNVEANYFGKNGLFLVAESDRQLVGFSGARAKSDQVLDIVRFSVEDVEDKAYAIEEMMRVFKEFAPRMLYHGIECSAQLDSEILQANKFSSKENGNVAQLKVSPDF